MDSKDIPIQFLLWQILHGQRHKAIECLESMDLKPGQAGCLFILSRYGSLPQKDIAEKLGVKPPSMTAILRKLEKKRFITKEQDSKDQRIFRIHLTDAGKAQIDQIKNMMKKMDQNMLDGILPEEKMLFRRLLLQIRENMIQKDEIPHCEIQEDCISDWKK